MDRRVRWHAGEDAAAEWYEGRGYRVLARNWRCREGEVDLIVGLGRTVVFCEVKARGSSAFGAPAEAVTWAKQRRLRRLAAVWLRGHPASQRRDVRFDVVSVLGDEIDVLEGVF